MARSCRPAGHNAPLCSHQARPAVMKGASVSNAVVALMPMMPAAISQHRAVEKG